MLNFKINANILENPQRANLNVSEISCNYFTPLSKVARVEWKIEQSPLYLEDFFFIDTEINPFFA